MRWKVYHTPGGVTGLAAISHIAQYFNAQPGDPLFDKCMATSPVGQFEYDAMTDNLPTVSWILPPSNADEHPANLPATGAQFVAGKIDAIAANPEVWKKTVSILSYDENDGLFDHVAPKTPPPGTPDEFVFKTSPTGVDGGGLPVGLGFRVPCIVVSPWTAGGWAYSGLLDHTSQLRLLERRTGVTEPQVSAWRRQNLGDFTQVFRFQQHAGEAPVLPDTTGQVSLAQWEVANLPALTWPTTSQTLPRQEPGGRPRLP